MNTDEHRYGSLARNRVGSRPPDGVGSPPTLQRTNAPTLPPLRGPAPHRCSSVFIGGFLLPLLGCTPTASAQTMTTRITDAPADARVLERTIDIRIEADGRMTRTERRVVEFLTDFAQEVYADPAVIHDSATQRLTIDVARTTEPDGTVQDTPEIGINELGLSELMTAPAFAGIRETVVTHVGIQPGAKAELAWTLEDTTPPPGGVAGGEVALQWAIPVEAFVLRVKVPAGTELQHECFRCALAPEVSEAGGMRTYSWTAERLEPIDWFESEPHVGGPEDGLDGPRIVFSTAADWETAKAPLWSWIERDSLAPSPAVDRRRLALTDGLPTILQQVEALQAFVGEELATIHLPRGLPFRLPASAEQTLQRSGGTPLEKAILLAALLRGLVEPNLVLVSGPDSAPSVPWLGAFPEAQVAVTIAGEPYWMPLDRRGVQHTAQDLGDRMLLPMDVLTRPYVISAAFPVWNLVDAAVQVRIADDGSASAEVALTTTGAANPYPDLREAGEDPAESLGDTASVLVPEGEAGDVVLEAFDSDRASATVEVSGRLLEEAPGMFTLPLAWPGDDPFPPGMHRSSRDTPLELEAPFRRCVRWEVELPDGWEVRLAPPGVRVVTAVGSFVQEVVVGDGVVTVERTLEVARSRVEPSEYEGLVRVVRSFSTSGSEPIVIVRETAH